MKQLFILAVIALGFVGCKKEDTTTPTVPPAADTNAVSTNAPATP